MNRLGIGFPRAVVGFRDGKKARPDPNGAGFYITETGMGFWT